MADMHLDADKVLLLDQPFLKVSWLFLTHLETSAGPHSSPGPL